MKKTVIIACLLLFSCKKTLVNKNDFKIIKNISNYNGIWIDVASCDYSGIAKKNDGIPQSKVEISDSIVTIYDFNIEEQKYDKLVRFNVNNREDLFLRMYSYGDILRISDYLWTLLGVNFKEYYYKRVGYSKSVTIGPFKNYKSKNKNINWGIPRDGFVLGGILDKKQYLSDESIVVDFYLKNISDKTLPLRDKYNIVPINMIIKNSFGNVVYTTVDRPGMFGDANTIKSNELVQGKVIPAENGTKAAVALLEKEYTGMLYNCYGISPNHFYYSFKESIDISDMPVGEYELRICYTQVCFEHTIRYWSGAVTSAPMFFEVIPDTQASEVIQE